jgi:predicted Zn-dependent peptidase
LTFFQKLTLIEYNPIMLKPITLKNGLTILRLPKSGSQVVSVSFILPTGSSGENGHFPQGISYLIERLFWAGTDKHPSKRHLNLAVEEIGGSFTSFTSQEMMGFTITAPDYHQNQAIALLAEIIQTSYFDTRDIEKEKKAIINELKEQEQTFKEEAETLNYQNLYQASSLGLPITGSIESINVITQEHILSYLSHQFQPQRANVVISGNFDNKPILELVEHEWGVWNPESEKFITLNNFDEADISSLPEVSYRQRGIGKTYLFVNFMLLEGLKPVAIQEYETIKDAPEPNYSKILDDYLARISHLLVLNTVLGGGRSSRLWVKSVEDELLFNDISGTLTKFQKTGFLQISGIIENSQFSFGLESVLSVLEGLKKTTIPLNELAKAKEFLKGQLIREHEDLQFSTLWKVEQLIGSGLNYELEDLIKHIDAVEVNALRDTAQELFIPERLSISTYGPAKETRLVDKLIRKYLL